MQLTRLRATWAFQALGDETRLRVVRLLATAGAPLAAGEIATALGVAPSHLSRHLQILGMAEITATQRCGRYHYVGLCEENPAMSLVIAAALALDNEDDVLGGEIVRLPLAKTTPGRTL
jgi:DNA-binding transcriptional ArsR family regulator